MKIEFLGHSSFLFCGEKSVVCDPFSKMGFDFVCPKVDFCLSSHNHYDHNATNLVKAKKYFNSNDVLGGEDISLEAIHSFHDELSGQKRGENIIFKFKIDGITFCHMGDFGEKVQNDLAKRIGFCDVLLLPVGGVFTIDAKSAAKIVNLVNPKIVIPMHFKTQKSTIKQLAGVDDFLREVDFETIKKDNPFTIDASCLPKNTVVFLPNSENF